MTEDQAPRQNRVGDPCPPWCTDNHDDAVDSMHRTDRMSIDLAGHEGYFSVLAGLFGQPDAEVVVHAQWYGAPEHLDGDTYIPVSAALGLAALVLILSRATPDQHRELAAAIRKAAADITGADGAR